MLFRGFLLLSVMVMKVFQVLSFRESRMGIRSLFMTQQNRFKGLFWVLMASLVLFTGFGILSVVKLRGKMNGSDSSVAQAGGGSKLFKSSSAAVGVLEINGVIMDSKKWLKKLKAFEEDDRVKGVVVRINSPGGAVAPSQEVYQAVRNFKKPLVSSMGSVAASGGYYIAVGTPKIFANAGTLTGSIGVIMQFANLKKLYEWAKVERYSIKTGKFKDSGADYREMGAEEKQYMQTMVDDVLSQFKQAVATGRKLPMDQVTRVADGRIFSGQQAKGLGLVDALGTLDDAIDDVAKAAKIEGKPKVIYSERPKGRILEMLFGDEDEDAESEASALSGINSKQWIVEAVLKAVVPGYRVAAPSFDARPGIYWLWNAN